MTSTDLTPIPTQTAAAPAAAELGWFETTMRQAEVLARSGIVPKAYQGEPDDIVVAAMYGRDFGWSPMQAMNSIVVLDGRPSLNAQAMVALVRQRGHSISGEFSATEATVVGRRADTGDEMIVTFSVWDAERAGLCTVDENGRTHARSKYGKPLPWEMYPQSMCWARAVSQLCRMLFADDLAGVSYTPEEVQAIDVPSVDVTGTVPTDESARVQSTKERRDYLRTEVARLDPDSALHWDAWKNDQDDDDWPLYEDTLRAGIAYVYQLLRKQGEEPFDLTSPSQGEDGHDGDPDSHPPAAATGSPSPADDDVVDGEIVNDGTEPF